jgi:superfamily II DNA/RNA helicase
MLITSLLSFALLVSPPNAFGGALPPWLIERAAALGYVSPTPVQAEAIDVVLSGRDAIIQAKTGSGKTVRWPS